MAKKKNSRWESELKELLRQSDYWYDLGISRISKRRRLHASDNSKLNSRTRTRGKTSDRFKTVIDVEDYEYKAFLKLLSEEVDADSVVDNVDLDYKKFLEHLREDGKSYVLEMKSEDGMSVLIKYEEEDSSSAEIKKKLKSEHMDCVFGGTHGCSSQKPGPTSFRPFFQDCKHERTSPVDESYYLFLNHVSINGNLLTLRYEDGIVKYEEDNETLTDSEGLAKEGTPYCGERNFTPYTTPKFYDTNMDDNDRSSVQSLSCVDLSFEYEEKLWKILRMPYNQKEYEELSKEANIHKPKERVRHLRNHSLSYVTDQPSSSYLDYHPDVADMIKLAQKQSDRPRALSLLRCLFFYYENLSHQGSFMPWRNPSIREMICGRKER